MTPKRDKARLEVRCEWDEIDAWHEAAALDGRTLSNWVRRVLSLAADKIRKREGR